MRKKTVGSSRIRSMPLRLCQLAFICIAVSLPGIAAAQNPAIDLDKDGMSDVWESIFAAENLLPGVDTDGDGRKNLQESIDGTNPFLADSKLETESLSVNLATDAAVLNWNAIAGKSYRFLASTDLTTWSPTGQPLAATADGSISKTLSAGGVAATAQFYDLETFDTDIDGDGLNTWEEKQFGFSDDPTTTEPDDFQRATDILNSPACHGLGNPEPPTLEEAARFLTQATLGADYEMIERVTQIGYEDWIDEQIAFAPSLHLPTNLAFIATDPDEGFQYSPYMWTWWEHALRSPDVLRQRIAFALSEIFVVSFTGIDELEDHPWGMADYYDILVDESFGNYRDLLYRVSTHPVMGHFLSHAKNRKSDLSVNRFPDENYAREVMQLFSIGLYELNPDGTRKKDAEGKDLPTYSNEEITQFAKVFTGMTFDPTPVPGVPVDPFSGSNEGGTIESEEDFIDVEPAYFARPMLKYGPMHEPGVKNLLNGVSTSGSSSVAGINQDLNAAVDNLFNHPNVGPFIGYRLIQRLVKSNPSPAYVSRVAAAFADNGEGVRGDMEAVIRAVLLDQEARCTLALNDPANGMLREPLVRYAHVCRAFNLTSSRGNFKFVEPWGQEAMKMGPLASPSVFNFFQPEHQPLGPIADAGLVAPEFQLTTATTTVATTNFWGDAIPWDEPFFFEDDGATVSWDLSDEIAIANNTEALVDRLDLILTRGNLSPGARSIITDAINGARPETNHEERVRFAVYLFVNSPDFAVLR